MMPPSAGWAVPLWRGVFWGPSLLYGAAVSARRWAYERGYLETVRVPAPVFCLGNLTAGGSGKTPGVIWLVDHLKRRGRRPAVLTRGYGREESGEAALVGAEKPLESGSARRAGDEPALLASRLPGVPILVGADRARTARRAVEEFGADCLVMDDGFQHLRLHRDVNLLCVDALEDRFLEGDERLLPAGRLREPVSALSRAHAAFLTKSNLVPRQRVEDLRRRLSSRRPELPVAAVRYALSFRDAVSGEDQPAGRLKGRRVLALTALARPRAFEEGLRALGADAAPLRYPDHHRFSGAELESARERALKEGRTVVVTEKDFQKLPAGFACWVARLDWEPEEAEGPWLREIDSAIS